MLETMTAQTLRRWRAFDEITPFGDERADLRMGILGSHLANIHIQKGRRYKPTDLIPNFRRPQQQSVSEMEQVMKQWAAETNRFFEENGSN